MLNFSRHKFILLIFITSFLFFSCQKEIPDQDAHSLIEKTVQSDQDTASGSGEYFEDSENPEPKQSCIPEAEAKRLQESVKKTIQSLQSKGIISEAITRSPVSFSWPVRKSNSLRDPGFYSITNFVDHNPNSNQITDYKCGRRSYDTSTFNHAGTDIASWPFKWHKMDRNQVHVIAAAPGHIVHKSNNRYDRNCSISGQPANSIIIRHPDGTRTWYWHLKKGSATSKNVGAYVRRGEYLGVVGSSGSSTSPHLHFEVRRQNGNLIDPFGGPCNSTNGNNSWWIDQKPYSDTGLNALHTHSAWPDLRTCNQKAIRNFQNSFNKGRWVYLAGYFRHLGKNRRSNWRLIQPNGRVFWSWTYLPSAENPDQPNFARKWWSGHRVRLPTNAQAGIWKFQISLIGQTHTHQFTVR